MKKIFLIICFLILTGCSTAKQVLVENKVNLNDQVIEDKKFNNFSTHNTSIIYDQGITTFKTVLKNNGEDININNVKVKFYNKNSTEIITLTKKIDKLINNNESIQVVVITDIDLSEAFKIDYFIE